MPNIRHKWLSQTDRQMLHVVEDVLERMYNSGRFFANA